MIRDQVYGALAPDTDELKAQQKIILIVLSDRTSSFKTELAAFHSAVHEMMRMLESPVGLGEQREAGSITRRPFSTMT